MKNIIIREFVGKDEAGLIKLFFEFGDYLKELDKKYLSLIIVPNNYGQAFYQKMITDVKNKKGKIFILEDSKKIVGFVAGVILEVGERDDEIDCRSHRMGRVIELFITKKYRSLGYGSKLMSEILKYFKKNNCYKVNIEVFRPNVSAYNFYKKHGFTERNIDMVKVI